MPRRTRPNPPLAPLLLLVACAASLGGCQRDATLIKWVQAPDLRVEAVELLAVSGEGASASVRVDLQSGAEVALPLTRARYTVEMNGREYKGDARPNAVLPAGRSVTVRLPAAVAGDPGDRYRVRGSIEYEPPDQVRKVLTDLGVPLPSRSFEGEGALTGEPRRVEDVPAPPAASEEKPGAEEARELADEEQPPPDPELPADPEDLVPAPGEDAAPTGGDTPEEDRTESSPPPSEP